MPVIIPLSPIDILNPAGYYSGDPPLTRRRILRRLMDAGVSYRDIISRLNATSIRLKNRAPRLSNNMKSDMKYMHNKYRN